MFTALYEIDPGQREVYNTHGWGMGAVLPEAVDTDTLNRALQAVGIVNDEAARFIRYAEVVLQGKKIMKANALLNMQIEMEKHQQQHTERVSPEGWRFYPTHVIAPQQYHAPICEEIQRQALQGEGLFKNFTEIAERPDEALDEFLGVEVYNVKCNFQLYLSKLQKYRVTGETLGKEFTHNLFDILNEIANYIKSNTDKPQGVKAHILGIIEALDNVPIWGLMFQILILQGLISLLENCTLKHDDEGYNEAQDLCNWLADLLSDKVCYFAMTGALYGDEDWERLQPLCDYLYNTETGRAVQDEIFNREQTQSAAVFNDNKLPLELDTDRARKYFAIAVDANYMEKNDTGYKWLFGGKRGGKARLAYFIERIYCLTATDKIQADKRRLLERLFGVERLDRALQQNADTGKSQTVKNWRAQIDNLFTD